MENSTRTSNQLSGYVFVEQPIIPEYKLKTIWEEASDLVEKMYQLGYRPQPHDSTELTFIKN